MAFKIAPREPLSPTRAGKVSKQPEYLKALHELPCVVSGLRPVEAAHVSFAALHYGHHGRGKGAKVHDRWALPLHADEHRKQHGMNEQLYWAETGIDPHALALRIYGCWCEHGDDFVPFAMNLIQHWRTIR